MGKDRQGNYAMLRELGGELGYRTHLTSALKIDGEVVSSSRIRFLLGAGQVAEAATLLGREFAICGKVIPGDHRGASLGFPTANLEVWGGQAIPAAGVYVCRARVQGKTWGAVTNIGVRPTFEAEPVPPRVETHLLDFQGDLYGQQLRLSFSQRLRGEQRFPNIQALIEQIQQDIHKARLLLQA